MMLPTSAIVVLMLRLEDSLREAHALQDQKEYEAEKLAEHRSNG